MCRWTSISTQAPTDPRPRSKLGAERQTEEKCVVDGAFGELAIAKIPALPVPGLSKQPTAQNFPNCSYAASGFMPSRTASRMRFSVPTSASASLEHRLDQVVRDHRDAVGVADDVVAGRDVTPSISIVWPHSSTSQRETASCGVR